MHAYPGSEDSSVGPKNLAPGTLIFSSKTLDAEEAFVSACNTWRKSSSNTVFCLHDRMRVEAPLWYGCGGGGYEVEQDRIMLEW